MTETSYPFTASPASTELQWSRMARVWAVDGVVAADPAGTDLKVTGAGTNLLTVAAGEAFANGFYYKNDADKNHSVPTNAGGGTQRIDRVVLRCTQSADNVQTVYRTGSTSPPTLTQDPTDVWEIPVAKVTVAAGGTTAQTIVDERIFTAVGVSPSNAAARRTATKNLVVAEAPNLLIGTGAAFQPVPGYYACTSSTRPSAVSAGVVIWETDTGHIRMYDGTTWLLTGGKLPAVRCQRLATLAVATHTFTPVPWTSTDDYDTDNLHSTGTNPTRITVSETGQWRFEWTVTFAANAAADREAFLLVNGGSTRYGWLTLWNVGSGAGTTIGREATLRLNAGDYVECVIYQTTGGTLSAVGDVHSHFSAFYTGPI